MAKYLRDNFTDFTVTRKPVKRDSYGSAPGQSEDGYGRKITTDYVVKLKGEKRQRRVYSTCWSNAASCWVIINGVQYHLMDGDAP